MNSDTAWQEWAKVNLMNGGTMSEAAFLAGYRRALQDAADEHGCHQCCVGVDPLDRNEWHMGCDGGVKYRSASSITRASAVGVTEHSDVCSLCQVPFKANITKAEIWCSKCDRFTRTVGVTADTGGNDA